MRVDSPELQHLLHLQAGPLPGLASIELYPRLESQVHLLLQWSDVIIHNHARSGFKSLPSPINSDPGHPGNIAVLLFRIFGVLS